MRICLYTATALPKLGGQEAVVDSLARHLSRLGHAPVVLAPKPRLPLRPNDGDLPYLVIRHPRFFSTRDFVSWYRLFLNRAHARHRFDVIHCHDVYPTGYLAACSKSKLRVPIVITSHGGDVRENNPRLAKGKIPQRTRAALVAADALVSIGPFTERGFRRIYPEASRIVTIPNGIDLEPYQTPAPRPDRLDSTIRPGEYVLFLGRLARRKGVDVLLQAMTRVDASAGNRLVVAGTGDEEEELKALSDQLGLASKVSFVGRVDGADKIYLLQNAVATVMPSRVWEAFPLVLIETFAAGRPLIGSDVPGIRDLLVPGETGLLFADEDVAGLAAAIARVFADRSATEHMGRSARLTASGYAWDEVTKRHVELYESLLAGKGVPADAATFGRG